jgi:vitamin B12 transporter
LFQTATIFANALAGLPPQAAWCSSTDGSTPSEETSGDAPAADHGPEHRYRTVVKDEAQGGDLAAQRRLDDATPGFVTAVDLRATPGARPTDALAEAIARTPGATTRSVGGLGQFSAVSLRGSSPQQVALFLDGVPLGGALAGLVDLSELPLEGLGRLEIHRGHVPIAFGSATLGGAINLVSHVDDGPPRVSTWGGLGSFGARTSGASISAPLTRRGRPLGPRWTLRVGYAGAEGDFPFYDTAGTPTFTGDDRTTRRLNNGYDRVLAQGRLDGRRGPTRWSVQEMVVFKHREEPGFASAPASAASMDQLVSRTTASIDRARFGAPGGRITWVFGTGIEHRRFDDPLGEVGLAANDQRVLSADLYASPRLRVPLWRGAFLAIVADARPEWIDVEERRGATAMRSGDARRSRFSAGAGTELQQFLWDARVLLVPAVRVDALANRFAVPPDAGELDDAGRDDATFGASGRLGARVALAPWLQLRGSAGRYFRPPTLIELFGDRGFFVGNEGLVPERGTAVDGGLVFDLRGAELDAYVQVAGFATRSEDLIQWVAAGSVSRPENVAAALVRGLESSVHLEPRTRAVTLTANYTLTDSADRSADASRRGRPLPGRPRHDLFTRATAGWEWRIRGVELEPRILYTVELIASSFLDPSGRFEVPTRAIQGLGAEVHIARQVHVAIEARNLLDVRTSTVTIPLAEPARVIAPIADFLGYPLPGRSVFAQIRIHTPWKRDRLRTRPRRMRPPADDGIDAPSAPLERGGPPCRLTLSGSCRPGRPA